MWSLSVKGLECHPESEGTGAWLAQGLIMVLVKSHFAICSPCSQPFLPSQPSPAKVAEIHRGGHHLTGICIWKGDMIKLGCLC